MPFFKRKLLSDPLADLPLTPHGAFTFDDPALESPLQDLQALLSATLAFKSHHESGDATFLLGLSRNQALTMFPQHQEFVADDVLDGFELSPSTYALVLRLLYGEAELENYHHDLLLLEMLGLHTPKPIALPFLAEWVEEQLTPKSIVRCLTHPMVDERIAGAAFKALMMHPSFSFAMLDHLPGVAQRISEGSDINDSKNAPPLKKPVKDSLREWSQHSRQIVRMVRKMVSKPPKELFFLAQLQRCIEKGGVWRLDDDLACEVAKGLHVFGMANGLRQRNHWFVNTAADTFSKNLEDVKRSLERFGYQLWQESEARQNGYGPALWVYWKGEAQGTGARRMLNATQATIGSLNGLSPLLRADRESRGLEEGEEANEDGFDPSIPGIYETSSGQYRHFTSKEQAAFIAVK